MSEETMSEEELAIRLSQITGATPPSDEKHNVHSFLNRVATSEDTTKLGFLKDEEVGLPKLPIRAFKNMALISSKLMDNPFFEEYFIAESEIISSTSLSRDAKLLSLAVLQKREVADVTKPRKINKGWFKPKDKKEDDE